MSEWFYAEGNRQQRGPLTSDELIALFQSSRIALDTLVWRDGMPQWQALRTVADEIGLVQAPSAAPTAVDTDIPAAQLPPQIPAGPYASQPPPAQPVAVPQKSLSGCAIAGIVAAVLGVGGLVLIAILAAIALPAYQDYTHRAKASAAYVALAPIKTQVEEFVAANGQCPVNDDEGFLPADGYALDGIAALRIGRFDNNHCGIEAELSIPGSTGLDGTLLWLDYDGDSRHWECTGGADDKYLPTVCRG